ncbi:Myosin type-2 heavy chain 1 [Nosema bombycis CQ1]|uniref:Myosin type-2 heavy chain 1 n=1 Tax=Nosema bombycis (strain CQ1 / CVCC 102059) TaxID=578461 RepID=R0MGB7_NOSB1|nr:Myosin type-2 heavy chain 1 [Nosema bombycis CQ1]|eukprot:EOB13185.1 Myosin type-2 heavy chain 1 [Nosema bombycis CQ1]
MRALDIDEETELFYYKIVAAVLHLGNLEFEMKNKQVEIVNIGTVDKICRLLSISSSDFIKCLIHPEIKAGHEVVTQHRTVEQVYRIVEALAKILYDKMFDSLIANLNRSLGTTVSSSFIGVLDIAGFEIFQENSFEQLCINYTNEKLQQYFNHHMFILEQEIYRQEAIDWNFIDFGLDLQPTIDLIESSNPIGIMAYLDEECVMPCASDKTFLEKLLRNIKSQKFKKINFKDGFNLRHYAGEVEYSVRDWIIKNKDPNFESITDLINKSEDAFVSGLSFAESKNLKKGFFRTVSQKHKDQLFSLMKTLSSTHPHFVRCIIPNLQKEEIL